MRSLKTTRKIKGFDDKPIDEQNSGYSKQGKKIIAVDFDGTLVHNRYPFCENPDLELIQFIIQHKNDYVWILWTCRHSDQLDMAIQYLWNEHGLRFDFVNSNPPWLIDEFGDTRKVYADYYIDDSNTTLERLIKHDN